MQIGDKYELEYQVGEGDSAKALSFDGGDDFPSVLATSRMIALMELAAARLMNPLLESDALSVGVGVNITHLAATPIDTSVRAVAEFAGMKDKLYAFKVSLFDKGGLAGEGLHTRAIVNTQRLLQGAQKRMQ